MHNEIYYATIDNNQQLYKPIKHVMKINMMTIILIKQAKV